MNCVSMHVSFPTHPVGGDPSRVNVHIGEQVPSCGAEELAMQIPGELGLSGPSQKCGTCAEGSVAGAGSQFPPPPLAGGTRHTGVGRGFTIMAFTEYVRPLLHALIPGPLAPRQSALVAQGRPVVPSNPWPEGWVVPTPVASWSSAPSDEPPLASVDDGHPMHAPKLWPSSSQVWAPVDATPGQAQATCWPGMHARWSAPLSANMRETAPRPKFNVEGEQAASRDDIIEPFPRSPALPHGSDVQGQEAAFHRRVQEEGPAGGRCLCGVRSDRRVAPAGGVVLLAPGDVAACSRARRAR